MAKHGGGQVSARGKGLLNPLGPLSTPTPGVDNVINTLASPSKQPTTPTATATPKAAPEPAPAPVEVPAADATADKRSFVRPTRGRTRRTRAQFGAFDPRQRTKGQIDQASTALGVTSATNSTLPSGGFKPKKFEDDQRLLDDAGIK